ncbi:MAG: SAM-dependent methyltransferase [Thermoflexibacter sp.]
METKFEVKPIGIVANDRREAIDDNWDSVISTIIINDDIPFTSLTGIQDFSHLEIIYIFNKAINTPFEWATYPRGNKNYPLTGIFAQRKKERPNYLGLCTVELIEVKGNHLKVKYLDAINGSPVLDIKPVFKEFEPEIPIKQADWASDLMKNYW